MPSEVAPADRWVKLSLYTATSAILAASPLWIREAILAGYDPGDTMGSPGDVFGWGGLVVLTFLIYGLMQLGVLVVGRFVPLWARIAVMLASMGLWIASIMWVHTVRVL